MLDKINNIDLSDLKGKIAGDKKVTIFAVIAVVLAVMTMRFGPVIILLWVLYVIAAAFFGISTFYKAKTGRDYLSDKMEYKLSTFRLITYFKDAEPHKLDTSSFPPGIWQDRVGIIFGKSDNRLVSIPTNSESNIAIFGPPGSGKTSGVAIPNACRFAGSVLAIDIKGDLYSYVKKNTKRKVIRFAPDEPDALKISCRFDPFDGFDRMNETDQKLALESMALILIPDEGGQDGNYFPSRARKLFQGIVYLIKGDKPDADFPYIVHQILEGNVFDWVKQAVNGNNDAAKEQLASFYGNNEKNVSGAYDTLTTALIHFSNPVLDKLLGRSEDTVSITTLDAGYDIYLQIKQEHLKVYAPIFTLMIQTLSTQFANRPDSTTGIKNRPILMLLDEFPQLTFSYDMINSSLSTLRSKSVIIMVIQQNMAQLEQKYQNTGARSIIGNCNYQIILGSNDTTSSETFSKTFGNKKILKWNDSGGGKKSISDGEEPVFPPAYFGDLPAEKKMVVYFKGKYCELKKINCYVDKIDGIQELPFGDDTPVTPVKKKVVVASRKKETMMTEEAPEPPVEPEEAGEVEEEYDEEYDVDDEEEQYEKSEDVEEADSTEESPEPSDDEPNFDGGEEPSDDEPNFDGGEPDFDADEPDFGGTGSDEPPFDDTEPEEEEPPKKSSHDGFSESNELKSVRRPKSKKKVIVVKKK